jgi:glycosyltransferase involved in cell wall biosynthesis
MKILWIAHTAWNIPQRAHLFCRSLAERHEVHATDWVADFASWRDYLSSRYLMNFTYRCCSEGNITIHRIPRVSPALYSRNLRRLNGRIFSWSVRRIIKTHQIDVVVGTFIVAPPRVRRLVFDLFDENEAGWRDMMPAYADEIGNTERGYLRASDAVVAASSVLADKALAVGCRGPVHLIPNGVELARFDNVSGEALRDRLGVNGALVGSVANHDNREEIAKILNAAKILQGPGITFLIAGRGAAMGWAQEQALREDLDNVRFMGYVSAQDLPATVSALDVGLCPYRQTPMDHARSPMRLLTYAAAGVPTVCTDLEEVRRMAFPNVVLVNDDSQSLAAGIEQALRLPRVRPPQIEMYDLERLTRQYEAVICSS